jgi:hypothetical protein
MIQLQKIVVFLILFGFCSGYAEENPFAQFSHKPSNYKNPAYDDDFDDDDEKGIFAWCKRHYIVSGAAVAATAIAGAVVYSDPALLKQVMQIISDGKSNLSDFYNTLSGKKMEGKQVTQKAPDFQQKTEQQKNELIEVKNDTKTTALDSSERKPESKPVVLLSSETKKQLENLQNFKPDVCRFIEEDVIKANFVGDIDSQKEYLEENIPSTFIEQIEIVFKGLYSEYDNKYLSLLDPNEQDGEFKYYWRIKKLFQEIIAVCDRNKTGNISKKDALSDVIVKCGKMDKCKQSLLTYIPNHNYSKKAKALEVGTLMSIGAAITYFVMQVMGRVN